MNQNLQHIQNTASAFISLLFLAGFAVFVLCFFINYSLVKSRGREDDMLLWMVFTFFCNFLITLILLTMPPVEVLPIDYEAIDFPNGRPQKQEVVFTMPVEFTDRVNSENTPVPKFKNRVEYEAWKIQRFGKVEK